MKFELPRFADMLKRTILLVVVLQCLILQASPVVAAELCAQIFPYTGEIRLINKAAAPLPIVFYSIKSPSNALTSSASLWKSITDNYDAPIAPSPGNGLVDPDGAWVKLSSTSMELAEGALDADGGQLLSWRAVSLGRIWNPNVTPFPDLMFEARETNSQPINVEPVFAIDGDYLADLTVNQVDYNLWRQYFGSSSILFADGNLDGVVDAADYVVWRNNRGLSIPSASIGSGSGAVLPGFTGASALPEPGAAILALAALGCLSFAANRSRRCR